MSTFDQSIQCAVSLQKMMNINHLSGKGGKDEPENQSVSSQKHPSTKTKLFVSIYGGKIVLKAQMLPSLSKSHKECAFLPRQDISPFEWRRKHLVPVQLAIIKTIKSLSQDSFIGKARKHCRDYIAVEQVQNWSQPCNQMFIINEMRIN